VKVGDAVWRVVRSRSGHVEVSCASARLARAELRRLLRDHPGYAFEVREGAALAGEDVLLSHEVGS
jgi:hypothetical protein